MEIAPLLLLTFNEKFPSKSDTAPLFVPSSIMFAPDNGPPKSLSVIVPVTVPCANENALINKKETTK